MVKVERRRSDEATSSSTGFGNASFDAAAAEFFEFDDDASIFLD